LASSFVHPTIDTVQPKPKDGRPVGAVGAEQAAPRPEGATDQMRLQLWAWSGVLLVVLIALLWSILRAHPTPSPLDGVRQVSARDAGSGARSQQADEGEVAPALDPPRPGHDPYAPEHPAFDQAQFERQLEAARPAREPR